MYVIFFTLTHVTLLTVVKMKCDEKAPSCSRCTQSGSQRPSYKSCRIKINQPAWSASLNTHSRKQSQGHSQQLEPLPDRLTHSSQQSPRDTMNLLPSNIRFAGELDIESIAEIEEFGNKDVAISHLLYGLESWPLQRIQCGCDELRGIMHDPKYKNWVIFVILEGEKAVGAAIIVVPSSSTSCEQVMVSFRYA